MVQRRRHKLIFYIRSELPQYNNTMAVLVIILSYFISETFNQLIYIVLPVAIK